MNFHDAYKERFNNTLPRIAANIERMLQDYLSKFSRIDRISVRSKSVDRFIAKSAKLSAGKKKYDSPLDQIQDQVGARIITFYCSDVEQISRSIEAYFRPIERKSLIPESEWEFGYVGKHYIIIMPPDVIEDDMDQSEIPRFFELQIKTLFQHAWSEANHDLGYKPGGDPLNSEEKRRLAFTAAQAWGADQIFDELFRQRE